MPTLSIMLATLFSLMLLAVPAAPAQPGPSVLFDQAHGQRFLIEQGGALDLSRLAGLFREGGYEVGTSTAPLTSALLSHTDALVLSGPFRPYAPEEIEAITAFVERGGALCITLHIASPLAPLLERFGVEHSNGVIHERQGVIEDNPLNFRVRRLADHPLFQGLEHISLYGVWALLERGPGVRAIARTSSEAWVDLNGNGRLDPGDAVQAFAVAVAGRSGKGRFVIFGDDAIFQNKFLTGDNLVLGRNLASWLAPGALRP